MSSRGLYSMPLCGQHWEPSSREQRQIFPTGNDCLAILDSNVDQPDNVNVSENDESADEQVSENLDSCIERSFLSQRQCRLNSDSCLEENFSALMHGKNSDGRVCVLEVCAARDSALTNAVRRRLHDTSSAERWTSRDYDLRKTSRRRSALTDLELVRSDHAVFFPPCSGDEVIERNTWSIRAACWFENNCLLEMRMLL